MGKHDLKADDLQVNSIRSNQSDPIPVYNRFLQTEIYSYELDELITRRYLEFRLESLPSGGPSKTVISNSGSTLSINWQTDIDPSGNGIETYADRHGDSVIIQAFYNDGGVMRGYVPSSSFIPDANGLMQTLTLTDLFPGTLTIL